MESQLLPFVPADTERRHPLAQKYVENAGCLATANLSDTARGASGSAWTVKETNAVRAIPLIDLDPRRIVPDIYFPRDDHKEFVSLRNDIRAASLDDIRQYESDTFRGNPYQSFFMSLSELARTKTSEDGIVQRHRRVLSDSSIESEISTSSNEQQNEAVSTDALKGFVRGTLGNMGRHVYLGTSANQRDRNMFLEPVGAYVRFTWKMVGKRHAAENDGGIGVNYRGRTSLSDRWTKKPVVSLECKPRNAGGLKRGSGEPETFNPNIFAQEVAEMIGSMKAQRSMPLRHDDQESFVISMHGTLFYVSAAYFSPDYIRYIEADHFPEADLNGDHYLWVRRSIHFDLKLVEHRVRALEVLWALVTYIASGDAKVDIVLSALKAP